MENVKTKKYRIPADYLMIMSICVLFVALAFALDTPMNVIRDLWRINTSRSVLVSDYIAMAGIGATLLNSAVSGLFFLILLIFNKCQPNGKIIAALFLTIGFALFGKNMVNTFPLCIGVWVYAKVHKAKFASYLTHAMFCATVAPIVSEIAFPVDGTNILRITVAYLIGMFIGFIFPEVMDAAKRMHRGYCLYNSGIAGGFIATFAVGAFLSLGLEIEAETFWDTEHTMYLAIGAFVFSAVAISFGIIADGAKNALKKFIKLIKENDRNNNDYLLYYGKASYVNIGIMCAISTATMLLLGIPINGPVLGGILTIAGFAVAGKHVKNTIPVLAGSIIAAFLNDLDIASSANALSILFSTGLAPIACKYGWHWGIIAGFMHVSVAINIGNLNGGLNLYNNGFAGGFVAITLVPLIIFFRNFVAKTHINNEENK
jgi:hypothetical protein